MIARTRGDAAWTVLLIAALALGTFLRCWQLGEQILIDDEWHSIHALLGGNYRSIATHFGTADYSIPLTLYYRFLYDHGGLTEWGMRLPLLAAGIALLFAGPWLLRRDATLATRAVWCVLLAISPVLTYLSRIARPYAFTCLLTLFALLAFRAWREHARRRDACGYVAATVLAAWLHPLSLCFCLTPFLHYGVVAATGSFGPRRPESTRALLRLVALGLVTAALLLLVLLPPLLVDWNTLAGKAGTHSVTADSAYRTALMLTGVRYGWLAAALASIALLGAVHLWQRERGLAAYLATVVLVPVIVIVLARPAWIHHPGVATRYVLPALPVFLFFTAEGIVCLLVRMRSAVIAPASAGVLAIGLVWAGPLPDYMYAPNQFMAHAVFQFDVDPARNPYVTDHCNDPVPLFYQQLASSPPQSLTLVEMPWQAISDVLYPWYQRIHRQNVMLGLAVPECGAETVFGEYPSSATGLRLQHYVHLDALLQADTPAADYLVVRPQPWRARTVTGLAWPDMQGCLPHIRARFGEPVFQDGQIVVFSLRSKPSKP